MKAICLLRFSAWCPEPHGDLTTKYGAYPQTAILMNQDSASDVDSPWCDPSSIRALFSRATASRTGKEASVPRQLRPAAVLVPLVARDSGITVLFTKRTDHLHHHPGQISFPGGRVEAHDESPVVAALRETTEEIGLDAGQVELLGRLPD